jgi:hypothetical protein
MALTVLFQGHKSEDRMWRLIGDRTVQAYHRTPIYFDELGLQEDCFDAMSRPSQQQLGFLLWL